LLLRHRRWLEAVVAAAVATVEWEAAVAAACTAEWEAAGEAACILAAWAEASISAP
jgi:hypothetical protein